MYSSVNRSYWVCDRCNHKYGETKDFWFKLAENSPDKYPLSYNKNKEDEIINNFNRCPSPIPNDLEDKIYQLPERLPDLPSYET